MNKVKVILMGTSEFAERVFRKAYPVMRDKLEIIAVFTATDKPVGRKQELLPSPVKKWALENNLKVLQPDKIRKPEWIKKIRELAPELIILTAYGQIIPKEILNIPKYKALNIHPSLLPRYRGASPIQSAILNDDEKTGVSLMIMDKEMDHGEIISNSKIEISNKTTYKNIEKELASIGAELLIKTLPDWIDGKIQAKEQDHSKATFCKTIKKEDGKIDWNKSAKKIDGQIRAYEEWPNAFTFWDNKQLKILEAEISNKNTEHKLGKVFLDENKNLCVQTKNGILILKNIQLEGKKSMQARNFINGYPEIIGSILK